MKGRKPKPTNLKILEGNPGRRPLNKNEPKPPVVYPKPPSYLDPVAKKCWKKMGEVLARHGLLTELDTMTFELLCSTFSKYTSARRRIDEKMRKGEDLTYLNEHGEVRRDPNIITEENAKKELMRLLPEFGMTPSSRSRIKIDFSEVDEDERRWKEWFNEYGG